MAQTVRGAAIFNASLANTLESLVSLKRSKDTAKHQKNIQVLALSKLEQEKIQTEFSQKTFTTTQETLAVTKKGVTDRAIANAKADEAASKVQLSVRDMAAQQLKIVGETSIASNAHRNLMFELETQKLEIESNKATASSDFQSDMLAATREGFFLTGIRDSAKAAAGMNMLQRGGVLQALSTFATDTSLSSFAQNEAKILYQRVATLPPLSVLQEAEQDRLDTAEFNALLALKFPDGVDENYPYLANRQDFIDAKRTLGGANGGLFGQVKQSIGTIFNQATAGQKKNKPAGSAQRKVSRLTEPRLTDPTNSATKLSGLDRFKELAGSPN